MGAYLKPQGKRKGNYEKHKQRHLGDEQEKNLEDDPLELPKKAIHYIKLDILTRL
jgi:hypothetical protein